MKVVTFEFDVSTGYVGSRVVDRIKWEFDDNATEDEIESVAEEAWCEWRNYVCEGGYRIVSEQIINNDDE